MKNVYQIFIFLGALFLASCVKEVKVELPDYEPKLVVEGIIEKGLPPYVILTKSVPYFDTITDETLNNLYVRDAVVKVSDGTKEVELQRFCSDELTPLQIQFISNFLGTDVTELVNQDICVYVSITDDLLGEENRTYDLTINYQGEEITASTFLPQSKALDSSWFQVFEGEDNLGYLWANLSDETGVNNYYRWEAMRINEYTEGELIGEQKDQRFIAPLGSAFDDKFFDGKSFEFNVYRGEIPNSTKDDDSGEEAGFYKVGDTVIVKFSSTDRETFRFLSVMEDQLATEGSPFASPSTIPTNLVGENVLGLWAAYSPVYDTVICE